VPDKPKPPATAVVQPQTKANPDSQVESAPKPLAAAADDPEPIILEGHLIEGESEQPPAAQVLPEANHPTSMTRKMR
jgi:hypothetical protein